MQTHIGTKIIRALPMTRQEYNDYRGWHLPADENGDDDGYLVEYVDGGKANDSRHAGYISWSPSDVFKRAYRSVEGMTFGLAIEALKAGKKVARAGWNGKRMWIALQPGSTIGRDQARGGAAKHRAEELHRDLPHDGTEGVIEILPHIDMRAADGSIVVGWLASQTDMLAEDWRVVE